MSTNIYIASVGSPLGEIVIAAREQGVCALDFVEEWPKAKRRLHNCDTEFFSGDPAGAGNRVTAYFEGEIRQLGDLPVDLVGTAFQLRTWGELQRIPPGWTLSYAELARRVGSPRGFRAVGAANRLNPVAIRIPCHRVVGSDGGLCGYAGGLERKRWLLVHEARHRDP